MNTTRLFSYLLSIEAELRNALFEKITPGFPRWHKVLEICEREDDKQKHEYLVGNNLDPENDVTYYISIPEAATNNLYWHALKMDSEKLSQEIVLLMPSTYNKHQRFFSSKPIFETRFGKSVVILKIVEYWFEKDFTKLQTFCVNLAKETGKQFHEFIQQVHSIAQHIPVSEQ